MCYTRLDAIGILFLRLKNFHAKPHFIAKTVFIRDGIGFVAESFGSIGIEINNFFQVGCIYTQLSSVISFEQSGFADFVGSVQGIGNNGNAIFLNRCIFYEQIMQCISAFKIPLVN